MSEPSLAIKRPVRAGRPEKEGRRFPERSTPGRWSVLQTKGDQERSFQVSLWMMLPSLYDQVIVS